MPEISSTVTVTGWRPPTQRARPGIVRSTAAKARRRSASASASRRAANASSNACFTRFTAAPKARRSSGGSDGIAFDAAVRTPAFRPSTEVCSASSASASSPATRSRRASSSSRSRYPVGSIIGLEGVGSCERGAARDASGPTTVASRGAAPPRQSCCAFASSAILPKASASRTARSASTLRFTSTPAGMGPGHPPAVAEPVQACPRVDPRDPEGAAFPLLLAAVAVGVAHAALDRLLRRLVQLAPSAAGALRGFHDLLLAGVVRDAVLYARHGCSLRLQEATDARKIGRAHDITLLEPVLPLARLLGQDVTVVGVEALELPRPGLLEALHRGALGFHLRHFDLLVGRKVGPPASPTPPDAPALGLRYRLPPVRRSAVPPSRGPYRGARTIVMFRPSSFASISTLPMSASSAATRSSTALPSSTCAS